MPITDALPDMERELKFFSATNDNPQKLTHAQIRQFNEQGYICPLDVFTPEEAAANRRYFDNLMAEAQANGHNSYSINGWHRHCRGIYDLLHEPRILDYVEDLLGPRPRQRYDPLLLQGAGRPKTSRLAPRRLVLAADPEQGGDCLAGHRRCG